MVLARVFWATSSDYLSGIYRHPGAKENRPASSRSGWRHSSVAGSGFLDVSHTKKVQNHLEVIAPVANVPVISNDVNGQRLRCQIHPQRNLSLETIFFAMVVKMLPSIKSVYLRASSRAG